MGSPVAAVLFALFATGLEIALAVLGFPVLLIVLVALVLIATEFLVITYRPLAIGASVLLYLSAVSIGIIGFSWLALLSQAL